jgi:hypothetical protein
VVLEDSLVMINDLRIDDKRLLFVGGNNTSKKATIKRSEKGSATIGGA